MEQIGVTVCNGLLEIDGAATASRMLDGWVEQSWFLGVELYPKHMGISHVLNRFNNLTVHGSCCNFPSGSHSLTR